MSKIINKLFGRLTIEDLLKTKLEDLKKILEEVEEEVIEEAKASPVPCLYIAMAAGDVPPYNTEATEFDVYLTGVDPNANMILVIKTLRELLHLGLKQAKDMWDMCQRSDPRIPLKQGLSKKDAELLKTQLNHARAYVEIREAR